MPGTAISEQQVADRLGISRIPVREALQALARDGLVEIYPSRGTFVARLSSDDLRELYQVREALEGAAAGLAADYGQPRQIDRLTDCVARALTLARAEPTAGRRDDEKLFELGASLHDTVAEASANSRLRTLLTNLKPSITRARVMGYGSYRNPVEIWEEHRRVVEAVQAHDASLAERMMRAHIRSAYRSIRSGPD